ncbi:ribosome hibernation-promoting factor, HPF/YfiA family [Staphylococcus saccharolyticus]|uniref:ribosome hibernation-promoting factor, HPF/YfiA family n=1 Tax=Staphylococcus saccharolyticus TaxID=33028 RepID=UPI00102D85E8|nr:ribosome-associated translation inhibitor RaiA [Staphylococcus saccharolyticus]MBL7572732.1 ribosome-associated translation inhibitor RaiA [Staphylococcus saccharolyticus]MBL7584333.1 ribosome-associated translation inhibitor RaiA [Staphylococcus saccharolyticus]MBL7638348.1 ribosome-associated translation inhibitor RaiA [Staphylococcus saccharolyticus]QRJ68144.1 ribosome-associated translation inhibitor RaiA [Staphylococcus saccharolyticus]TAA93271.1 ribosome-associated translation inhibit
MIRFEIHGDNLTITDAIRNYIEDKIGKLERYFNNVPNAVAHVKVKTYSNSTTKIEVTIPLKDVTLRAEEGHDDLYAGIDLITNKLERQVRKYKTRVNRKYRDRGDQDIFVAEVQEAQPEEDSGAEEQLNDSDIEIIRSKQFSLKPMDSEEAILQMNLLGHDFFIFTDRETDGTSIVYRRKDGKYGLIETTE